MCCNCTVNLAAPLYCRFLFPRLFDSRSVGERVHCDRVYGTESGTAAAKASAVVFAVTLGDKEASCLLFTVAFRQLLLCCSCVVSWSCPERCTQKMHMSLAGIILRCCCKKLHSAKLYSRSPALCPHHAYVLCMLCQHHGSLLLWHRIQYMHHASP